MHAIISPALRYAMKTGAVARNVADLVELPKRQKPKTSRGRRVVVLPDFVIRALRAHRKTQAEERLLLGAEYENHGFVFASEFGRPLHLSSLYRYNFRRIMRAAGLGTASKNKFTPKYRLYDLRHTAATLLLRAGENPKVVSERLGHASAAFTMGVYAASLPDLQEGAAQKMETLFGASA